MNITAMATAGMFHAIEFRDRQRSCQRRPPPTRRSRGGADEPICGDRTGQDDVTVEPPLWRGSWPGNAARFHHAPDSSNHQRAGVLLTILYGYAWIFAAFTEAHTNVVRSRLSLVIPALLYQVNFLVRARASGSSKTSSGSTLDADRRVEVALGGPPPVSL